MFSASNNHSNKILAQRKIFFSFYKNILLHPGRIYFTISTVHFIYTPAKTSKDNDNNIIEVQI